MGIWMDGCLCMHVCMDVCLSFCSHVPGLVCRLLSVCSEHPSLRLMDLRGFEPSPQTNATVTEKTKYKKCGPWLLVLPLIAAGLLVGFGVYWSDGGSRWAGVGLEVGLGLGGCGWAEGGIGTGHMGINQGCAVGTRYLFLVPHKGRHRTALRRLLVAGFV